MKTAAEVKAYYDNYQFRFKHNVRHYIVINKLVDAGLKKTDKVLEIGCGNGAVTKLIAEKVKKGSVTGLDISSVSITAANINLKHCSNANFIACNVSDFDSSEKFNVVVLSDVLEHIPIEYHDELFKKLKDLLSDDGFIFINIPEPAFLEWVALNEPEKLQVIDQPLHSDELILKAYKNGLYLKTLMSYSIYKEQSDSQYVVFVKKDAAKNYKSYSQSKIIIKKYWAFFTNFIR